MSWLEQDWGLGQTISQVPGALLASDLNISKTYPAVEFTPQEASSRYEEIREVTGDWYFVTNAHFDGTNWVPINLAIQPFGYRMLSDGTRQWIDGVIGANPITWTVRVTISASGTLNTHTIPSGAADTFALLAAAQTLTNKSLTSPTITGTVTAAPLTITGNFVLAVGGTINSITVPIVVSDTFVLLAAAQTLTGKTLTSPTLTSPRIGTSLLDVNGNKWIDQSAVASAADGIQVTNAAAANPATVALSAVGTDANINLNLVSKGTGVIQINGATFAVQQFLVQSNYTSLNTAVGTLYGVTSGFDSAGLSATEADRQQIVAGAGTLKTFAVLLPVAPGTTATRTFTVRKNGVDTALTVTFGSGESGLKTLAVDVSVVAGDLLSIASTVGTTTAAGSRGYFSVAGKIP